MSRNCGEAEWLITFVMRVDSLDITLKDNERIDDLQYKGLRLIQKEDGFCFGIDAVLLSYFAQVPKNGSVIDLGTGTGSRFWWQPKKTLPGSGPGNTGRHRMASRSVPSMGWTDRSA